MYAIYNSASKTFLPPCNLRGSWAHTEPGPTPRIFVKRMDAVISMRHWLRGPIEADQATGEPYYPRPRKHSNWAVVPVRVEVLEPG